MGSKAGEIDPGRSGGGGGEHRRGRATPADGWLDAFDDLAAQVLSVGGALLSGMGAEAGRPAGGLARERYGACADTYDAQTAWGDPYRREGVLRLSPAPGEVIVDVGCGTGLNFDAIQAGIGPAGTLVGVDLCPEMLARAGERARRRGWENVTLISAPAEGVELPVPADGALFCATHDVLQSPAALENIVDQLKPSARVVAVGAKWVPPWRPDAMALNLCTWHLHRPFVTTFAGFDRPWRHLAALLADFSVRGLSWGAGYIAAGRRPGGQGRPRRR